MYQLTTDDLLNLTNSSQSNQEMLSQQAQASSILVQKKQSEKMDTKYLENDFLEAIQLIESQASQINGSLDEEILFLLGNTGCGKSTLFNWLMGNELIVKKDKNLKAANWIVETEQQDSVSEIGHVQVSTTSIPKISKSKYGPYLVDFPGWQDTRGWQYDFVNQFVAAHLTSNCKVKQRFYLFVITMFLKLIEGTVQSYQ